MDAAQDIIERAQRLPPASRRRIIDALGRSLPGEDDEVLPPDEREKERRASIDRLLALGGKGQSDSIDVARNKHDHLASIYADKHQPADKK